MGIDVKKLARAATRWVGSPQSIGVHTLVFAGSFASVVFGVLPLDRMLLILTTLVSLEAIYLAIFIQMTINEQAEDIDEIQEDIDEIQEDIDEMQEDVEELHEEEIKDDVRDDADHRTLETILGGLNQLTKEVESLKKR